MRKIVVLAAAGAFVLASGSAFAECAGHMKTVSDTTAQQTVMTDQATTPVTTKKDTKG